MATRPVSPAATTGGGTAPSAPSVPADSRRKSRLETDDLVIRTMIALSIGPFKGGVMDAAAFLA